MKRIFWALVIAAVLAGGAFATFRDPGRIHIYSAAGQVLAETELEGWCSGNTYWKRGGAKAATACREERAEQFDTTVRHSAVQMAFCQGARAAGFDGDVTEGCLVILQARELWPTMDGRLAYVWSDSYPYPLAGFSSGQGEETDDRDHSRNPFQR